MNRLTTVAKAAWLFNPLRKEVRMLKDRKTIITGAVMIAFNALRLFGIDTGIEIEKFADAINTIALGAAFIFQRLAIKKVQPGQ